MDISGGAMSKKEQEQLQQKRKIRSFASDLKKRTGLGFSVSIQENVRADVNIFSRKELEKVLKGPRLCFEKEPSDHEILPGGQLVVPENFKDAPESELLELNPYRDIYDVEFFPFVQVHHLYFQFEYPNTPLLVGFDMWKIDFEKYLQSFQKAKTELFDFIEKEYEADAEVLHIRYPLTAEYYVIDKTVGSIQMINYREKKINSEDPDKVVMQSFCTPPAFISVLVTHRGSRIENDFSFCFSLVPPLYFPEK